jgi:cytochrome c553
MRPYPVIALVMYDYNRWPSEGVALRYRPHKTEGQLVYHPRLVKTQTRAVVAMRMRLRVIVGVAILSVGLCSMAADVDAGKTVAQAKCAECHAATDWEGEDAASLESLIRDIASGKVKHKGRIDLSSAEMSNVAAYWGTSGKGKRPGNRNSAEATSTKR